MKPFTRKNAKACLLAVTCGLFINFANAQVFQNDYTSFHPSSSHWLESNSIYRDDATNQYFIAQQVWKQGSNATHRHMAINVCDPDMNVIQTWEYADRDLGTYFDPYDMSEMTDLGELVVVGRYIDESGGVVAPYVSCIDKNNGRARWFHLFPDLEYLYSIVGGEDYSIVVGFREHAVGSRIYSFSKWSAVIMKLDAGGNIVWERDFEDDKNMSSPYTITSVYNVLNDVTRIEGDEFVAVGKTNNYLGGNINDIWDADAMIVRFDANGNIHESRFLGNLNPLGVGNQPIQYEAGQRITYDPTDNTVVIAGTRLDNAQTVISSSCPPPDDFGIWVTKVNPYGMMPVWSKQYLAPGAHPYGDYMYGVGVADIDWDSQNGYGIAYTFQDINPHPYYNHVPVITKIDNNGSVVYSRHHYQFDASGNNTGVYLKDLTRAFANNDMMSIGVFDQHVHASFLEPMGWNVETFDNIQQYCLMNDLQVEEVDRNYEVGDVEYMHNWNTMVNLDLRHWNIVEDFDIACEKKQVAKKMADTDTENGAKTQVVQDETSRNLVINVQGNMPTSQASTPANGKYNIVLMNTMGQRVLQAESNMPSYKLNAADIAAGIYYLHISNGSFKEVHTISIR